MCRAWALRGQRAAGRASSLCPAAGFSCRDPILTHLVLPVSREIPRLWTAPALEHLPVSGQSASQTELGTVKWPSSALCVPGAPPPGGWGESGPAAGGQGRQREPGVGGWDRVLLEGGGDPVEYVTSDPSACMLQLAGQRPLPTHPQPSRAFCPAGRPCHPAPCNTPPRHP